MRRLTPAMLVVGAPASARAEPESALGATREAVAGTAALWEVCRARSRNSLLTSRAVCIRCRGSFSRHRRMMRARSLGRSDRRSVTRGGLSRRIDETSSAEECPSNGRHPVAISSTVAPVNAESLPTIRVARQGAVEEAGGTVAGAEAAGKIVRDRNGQVHGSSLLS